MSMVNELAEPLEEFKRKYGIVPPASLLNQKDEEVEQLKQVGLIQAESVPEVFKKGKILRREIYERKLKS